MFDLDGFWPYKSQVMKNPTIFLVFLLSSASTRLYCGPTRLYCDSTKFYFGSTRLYCGSRRPYCGVRRLYCGARKFYCGARKFYCGVRRKLSTKNSCFSQWKIYSCQMWKLVIRKNSFPGKKIHKIFFVVCLFTRRGPFFQEKYVKTFLPCVHFPAGALFLRENTKKYFAVCAFSRRGLFFGEKSVFCKIGILK